MKIERIEYQSQYDQVQHIISKVTREDGGITNNVEEFFEKLLKFSPYVRMWTLYVGLIGLEVKLLFKEGFFESFYIYLPSEARAIRDILADYINSGPAFY